RIAQMSSLVLALSLSIATLSGAFAPQQAGSSPLEPVLEARVQKLGKQLRCATCQGLSIADSPASMARAQLDKVREFVSAGKSDEEIRAYFVARYGEWILLSPQPPGLNLAVWVGPGVVADLRLRGPPPPVPPHAPAGDAHRQPPSNHARRG